MKRIDFKRGAGTFLEYSITGVMLTVILLMIVGIFIKRYSIENFNLYSNQIARDIVTCTSIEEARQRAEDEAQMYFSNIDTIDMSTLKISVEYSLGSDAEWEKGNYITLYIEGYINSATILTSSYYNTSTMVMIENDG